MSKRQERLLKDIRRTFRGYFTDAEIKRIIIAGIELCGAWPARQLISIRRSPELKSEYITKAELLALC